MAKPIFTAEWFPYYHERFDSSDNVAAMSLTEEGAYHRAIRLAWKYGDVPADPVLLAARIQKRCTPKIAEKILRTFVPKPGNDRRMIHPVVEQIRGEQERKYLNRRKGGIASRKNAKKSAPVNDEKKGTSSITEQCSSNTPTRIENRDKREEKREAGTNVPARAAAHPPESEKPKTTDRPDARILCPADFTPDPELIEWGRREAPHVNLLDEVEEFVTFWRDIATKANRRTRKGWRQTFQNRMRELESRRRMSGLEIGKSNGTGSKKTGSGSGLQVGGRGPENGVSQEATETLARIRGRLSGRKD